jgi:nucleoside-triphosphatase
MTHERAKLRPREREPHVLLITGAPGVGKTTVIRRVAAGFKSIELGGFYTEEIREDSERRGFRLVSFNGPARVIAHVDFPKSRRVGKYGVDVAALDEAADLLRRDLGARIYFVDEIGKMECLSERFVAAMRALLSGQAPVVATVGVHGGGFIAEVKKRPDCELWQITRGNRDALPARILAWLGDEQRSSNWN